MNILILASHPDDEVLGCGGTIAKHVANKDLVVLVTLTDGVGARRIHSNEKHLRNDSLKRSCEILGIHKYVALDFPDNKMDSLPLLDLLQKLENSLAGFVPDIVYTHSMADLNIDHRITSQLALTLFRPFNSKAEIRTFEVLSSTHINDPSAQCLFRPNLFIDISTSLEIKIKALEAYNEELRPFPHPRSIEGVRVLAKYRGMMAGLDCAKAFEVIRKINL